LALASTGLSKPKKPGSLHGMTKRFLELIFFDAGGGHRSATEALRAALAETHPDWDVTVTDLQEILKSADPLYFNRRPFAKFLQCCVENGTDLWLAPFFAWPADYYKNLCFKNGRRFAAALELK